MIETEQQRRWWFATHPEYSWSNKGDGRGRSELEESDGDHSDYSPEDVDAYVDEQLQYESGPVAKFLESFKREFGTQGYSQESSGIPDKSRWETEARTGWDNRKGALTYDHGYEDGTKWILNPNRGPLPPLVMNSDYMAGFHAAVQMSRTQVRIGWEDGYRAVKKGRRLPDLSGREESAYAVGVRAGAAAALDEEEAWTQKWIDPLFAILGISRSRKLGKNLEKSGELRPSSDYDAHHIVPWRHWRAGPARKALENCGIKIDAVENGVWLYRPYHWTLNNSKRYFDAINRMLQGQTDKEKILRILGEIKDLLSTGGFPL